MSRPEEGVDHDIDLSPPGTRLDDGEHDERAALGPVTVSTPMQWLLGCLVLWVFVVPLYVVARDA
jgi:hypothetical protein